MSLPSCVNSLPAFGTDSQLTRLPNLRDYDIDEQFPANMQSKYVTISELASMETSPNYLVIFRTKIGSLSLHVDELVLLCGQTKKPIDIIGVSEMWNSMQNENLIISILKAINSTKQFHLAKMVVLVFFKKYSCL